MQEPVCRQRLTVTLAEGLHMRPVALIAKAVRPFPCEVRLINGNVSVDAKNVLEALSINAMQGAVVEVVARGERADEALAAVVRLFETNFPEGESGGGG